MLHNKQPPGSQVNKKHLFSSQPQPVWVGFTHEPEVSKVALCGCLDACWSKMASAELTKLPTWLILL